MIAAPPSVEHSTGYVMIKANGGLNQQRVAVDNLLFGIYCFLWIFLSKDDTKLQHIAICLTIPFLRNWFTVQLFENDV